MCLRIISFEYLNIPPPFINRPPPLLGREIAIMESSESEEVKRGFWYLLKVMLPMYKTIQ